MRTIKTILTVTLLVGLTACHTNGIYDPVKTQKAQNLLRPQVETTVFQAINNSPQHSDEIAKYLHSAQDIFCAMQANKQFSPDYLIAELDKLVVPKNLNVIMGKNFLIGVYVLNFSDRGTVPVSDEAWGGFLTKLMCEGIGAGLKDAGK